MGKKTKVAGVAVGVMEATPTVTTVSATSGVRTRARASTLQLLHASHNCELSSASALPSASSSSFSSSSPCYLQLRSRRLHKPAFLSGLVAKEKSTKIVPKQERRKHENRRKDGRNEFGLNTDVNEARQHCASHNYRDLEDAANSVFSKESSSKCQISRISNTLESPSSTTRKSRSNSTDLRLCNDVRAEIEEFFSLAERQQQSFFIEKYNFDVVNEIPLPGRYEWVQLL